MPKHDLTIREEYDDHLPNAERRSAAQERVLRDCIGALDSLLHQVSQMRGMFPDGDGAIQYAVDDAEQAAAAARKLVAR